MSLNSVCRLCLATDAPMHIIADSPLQGVYEKLTDVSLTPESVLSTECFTLLQEQANIFNEGMDLPLPALGHQSVCLPCGRSILRATRTYPVEQHRQERSILMRPVLPHLLNTAHWPVAACYLCYSQLSKSHKLMVTSVNANNVLTQMMENGEVVNRESIAMIDYKTYRLQYALTVTPVEIISFTGTDHDLVKIEGKEEPLSTQAENVDVPTMSERIMFAESEDESDIENQGSIHEGELKNADNMDSNVKRSILEDDIENQGVTDEEESNYDDNMDNEVVENRKHTDKVTFEESEKAELTKNQGSEGVVAAKKYQETYAEIIYDGTVPTPGVENGPQKTRKQRTDIEEDGPSRCARYMLRSTRKAANDRQVSKNTSMYPDTAINKGSSQKSDLHSGGIPVECDITNIRVIQKNDSKILLRKHMTDKENTFESKSRLKNEEALKKYLREHNGENFVCDVCELSFKKKGSLSRHLAIHTGKVLFACESAKKPRLSRHLRMRTGETLLKCGTRTHIAAKTFERKCEIKFKGKPVSKFPSRNGITGFECDVCQKKYHARSQLIAHLSIHTGEKHIACKICDKRFAYLKTYKAHLRNHTGELFSCETCQRTFNTKPNLVRHLAIHTGDKPYSCEVCGARYYQKNHLNGHLRLHTGEKPYECEICKRRFKETTTLKLHLTTHSQEKPFECDICKVKLRNKVQLRAHLNTHNSEKLFECAICQRKFKNKNILDNHVRVHTGEKPFECKVCQRKFSQKASMNRHLRIHTGVKPYECDVCQRRYIQKGCLVAHFRTHHGKK